MAVSSKHGWLAALAVGSMLLGSANMVSAQSGGQVVKERRALMKDNNRNVKAIVGYLKKGRGSAADVGMWARHIAGNAARIPDLFPKGTTMIGQRDTPYLRCQTVQQCGTTPGWVYS